MDGQEDRLSYSCICTSLRWHRRHSPQATSSQPIADRDRLDQRAQEWPTWKMEVARRLHGPRREDLRGSSQRSQGGDWHRCCLPGCHGHQRDCKVQVWCFRHIFWHAVVQQVGVDCHRGHKRSEASILGPSLSHHSQPDWPIARVSSLSDSLCLHQGDSETSQHLSGRRDRQWVSWRLS